MKAIVTGGAGFIGSNLVNHLITKGHEVKVVDNLSRKSVDNNLKWLQAQHKFEFINADIRKPEDIMAATKDCDTIFHTAAQTAVTTSLTNPREDFEINALGTFNVLEAARLNDCGIVFCSTNKVFGFNVNKVPIVDLGKRYMFEGEFENGVTHDFPIDSEEHTPYGTSKLAGDQYVRDYATIYGLNTVVNRMSCIYGKHQFGSTDQGWVVHFIYSAISGKPLIIYGDGKQVRDILYGEDLAKLFEMEALNFNKVKGKAFTIGGGKDNVISLLELIDKLEQMTGNKIPYTFEDWRPADQKVYYSDLTKIKEVLGWQPETSMDNGIKKTFEWVKENQALFK